MLAYVGKVGDAYEPFFFSDGLGLSDIEISEDMYIVSKEVAEEYLKRKESPEEEEKKETETTEVREGKERYTGTTEEDEKEEDEEKDAKSDTVSKLQWSGEIGTQKWMLFYNNVLAKFATGKGLKLTVNVEIAPEEGISKQNVEETKVALRELGLDDEIEIS